MQASDLIKYAAANKKDSLPSYGEFVEKPGLRATGGGLLGGILGGGAGVGVGALAAKALKKNTISGALAGGLLGLVPGSMYGRVKGAQSGIAAMKDKRLKGYKPTWSAILGGLPDVALLGLGILGTASATRYGAKKYMERKRST